MAIIKASYIRRGRNPRMAAQAASRAAHYYTSRDGPDRDGRVWHASDGRSGPYATFKAEIYAQAKAAPYSYRIVLSTRDADLGPEGYRAVLGDRFIRYYFVEHHNTEYPHAHVIGYTATKLSTNDLNLMRRHVKVLEQARAHDRAHQADPFLERRAILEWTDGNEHTQAGGMTAMEPTPRRSRGRGLE